VSWEVCHADCIEAMQAMDAESIDAVVCDPPYGISFMGKEWDGKAISAAAERDRATRKSLGDHSPSRPGRAEPRSSSAFGNEAIIAGPVKGGRAFQEWCETWATEALRVLKPGGHLLAFGGTRTYHRLAAGIEDAGFEIRDCLTWNYGSGFPKSLNVAKAIDKANGAEPEVVETIPDRWQGKGDVFNRAGQDNGGTVDVTRPCTDEAKAWEGWGTALKPSWEPIVMARKPIPTTVAHNVQEHGTGALNIDATRIPVDDADRENVDGREWVSPEDRVAYSGFESDGTRKAIEYHAEGRWPANMALSPEAAAELDAQAGPARSAGFYDKGGGSFDGPASIDIDGVTAAQYGDSGGPSRFFYIAKASKAERNAGLEDFPEVENPSEDYAALKKVHQLKADGAPNLVLPTKNPHPTVKPIDLMRWLIRMVTPPGGTVLDPFTGSGTTGCAAVLEGVDFIGVEREAEYVPVARARIDWWVKHEGRDTAEALQLGTASDAAKREHREAGQMELM